SRPWEVRRGGDGLGESVTRAAHACQGGPAGIRSTAVQVWTDEQCRHPESGGRTMRRSKYANEATTVHGVRFDSRREARRWLELKLLEGAGLISELRRQVRFELVVNELPVCAYVADFVYREDEEVVVEDAKGMRTREYRIKARLMRACHGIVIREV